MIGPHTRENSAPVRVDGDRLGELAYRSHVSVTLVRAGGDRLGELAYRSHVSVTSCHCESGSSMAASVAASCAPLPWGSGRRIAAAHRGLAQADACEKPGDKGKSVAKAALSPRPRRARLAARSTCEEAGMGDQACGPRVALPAIMGLLPVWMANGWRAWTRSAALCALNATAEGGTCA